jgi:hypothetical protein
MGKPIRIAILAHAASKFKESAPQGEVKLSKVRLAEADAGI